MAEVTQLDLFAGPRDEAPLDEVAPGEVALATCAECAGYGMTCSCGPLAAPLIVRDGLCGLCRSADSCKRCDAGRAAEDADYRNFLAGGSPSVFDTGEAFDLGPLIRWPACGIAGAWLDRIERAARERGTTS